MVNTEIWFIISLQPHGRQPAMLLCPWNSSGKNTGVDSHSLLQGIFLTQGSNLGLLLPLVFSSVQFSHSVVSDSLRHHESQHARPSCPSPTLGVHSDSRPLSQWCHPAISSSVIPFSSCPQFLPASESFPLCQLFAWGGQRTGVSALASFLPKRSQGWSPSEWTDWDTQNFFCSDISRQNW